MLISHLILIPRLHHLYLCVSVCVCMLVPLAPPQSIHVDFLDFTGRVRWLPAPGNPRDTSYTAQLKAVEQDNFWHDLRGCDRTVATECPLNIDPLTSNLYAQYFVRVRAERLEAVSKWTTPNRTFQPYGDTLLSAPIMDVKVESEGVHVFLTHRQTFLPSLTYVLTLREWSGDLVATVEASSYREFSELSPNHSYCLSASAKHQALVHQTAEKCFDLPPRQDFKTYVGVALGGVLLVALIALIAVTWCCLKDEDHTPIIRDTRQPAKQLLLTPEYVLCEPLKRPLDEEEDEEVEEEVDGACDLYIPRVVASGPNSGPRLNPGNQGTAQGSGLPSPAIPNPPFIQSDYNYVSEDLDWDLHPDTQTPEGSASSTEETQLPQDLHSEGEGNQGRATNSGAPDSGRIVGQGVPVQRGETDSRDGGACSDDEGGRDGSVQDAAPGGPPVPWEAGLEMREEPLVFVRSEYETHWMP